MYSKRRNTYNKRRATPNQYTRPDTFGTVMPIPVGAINKASNPRDIKDSQVSSANNMWISADGYTERCQGYADFSAVLSEVGKPLGEFEYILDHDNRQMIVAYDNGTDGFVSILDSAGEETIIVGKVHETGTATAGGATTLTDSGATFGIDAYKGYYAKITEGTGLGQEIEIESNTGTVVTVIEAWTTNPDATSVYEIISKASKDDRFGFTSYINSDGLVLVDTITATSGTVDTITKTGETWVVDIYKGKFVIINGGTGIGQFRQIKSNTADTLTIADDFEFETTPDTTTTFRVVEAGNSMYFKQKDGWLMEWNGTDLKIYPNTPKGNALYIWKESLRIGGGNDSVFMSSVPLEVTNFTGDLAYSGNVGNENGQDQTAFMELPNDRFVAFKEGSYQVINGVGGTVDVPIVSAESVNQSMGVCNPDAICEVPSFGAVIMSWDKKLYPFGLVKDILSNVVGSEGEISQNVEPLLTEISDLSKVTLAYDDINEKIYICYGTGADTYNTKILIYDYKRKQLTPFWYRDDINAYKFFVFNDELYFSRSDKAQICKMNNTKYYNSTEFEASITFKDYTNKMLNPKEFESIQFSLKNAQGSMTAIARITDADSVNQTSTTIPLGSAIIFGGSGAIISGLVASGSPLSYPNITASTFLKRTMPLGGVIGNSMEVELKSNDYMSIGTMAITGVNYGEDEEDINIQF